MQSFEREKSNNVVCRIITVLFFFIILNQGGYFEGAIAAAGIAEALILFFAGRKTSKSIFLMPVFCLWYFICSIKNEIVTEYALRGLIPSVSLMFCYIIPQKKEKYILNSVLKISVIISVCSIINCVAISMGAMQLKRSLFPFQYSNADGIYFSIIFLLLKNHENTYLKKSRWIVGLALMLTQSVGAVGLTVIGELILDYKKKKLLVIFIGAIILGFCFHERLYESIGTFTERLLQIYDGIKCIIKNPIFGIGAGRWELLKPYYQSGFYSANTIHSSIVQIGVNSGFIGIAIFIMCLIQIFIKLQKVEKKYLLCAVILIVHSCMDFTMSFLAVNMLSCLIFMQKDNDTFKNTKHRIPVLLILVMFMFIAGGLYESRKMNDKINKNEYLIAIDNYNSSFFLKHSSTAFTDYLKSLYAVKAYDELFDLIDNTEYPPAYLIILQIWCCENSEVMIKNLRQQPYNITLYNEIYKCDDKFVRIKADEILQSSIENMSYFGKLLYKKQGGIFK